MNSVGANCNELKQQYDACFNSWFVDKFLKGDHEDSACAPLFRVYQACVKKAMKEQNIDFKAIAEKDFLSSEYPPKSETHTGNESTDSKAKDSNTKGNS